MHTRTRPNHLTRLASLVMVTLLAACSGTGSPRPSGPGAPRAAPQGDEPSLYYLQVQDKGRVAVQIRAESFEACQRLRMSMLNAAERAYSGQASKDINPNLVCRTQREAMAYGLQTGSLVLEFASKEGCEHYAIVKGLMPPHPAPDTKPLCLPLQIR